MSDKGAAFVIERTYRATVEELWEMWTTKEGFESWWAPEGIRTVVHAIEPRLNGKLSFEMIAESPEVLAVMKDLGLPKSHIEHHRFSEVRFPDRLVLAFDMSFLPGVEPYESTMTAEFFPVGGAGEFVRMVITLGRMHSAEHEGMAAEGLTSQVRNLDRLFPRKS